MRTGTRTPPIALWLALATVGALWLASRTQAGGAAIGTAVAAGAAAVQGAGEWLMSQIRGIRNNNPGNIRRTGDAWLGMAPDQSSDPLYVVFSAPEYGVRALARILKNYYAGGLTTLEQIITRWAPPSENDTAAYIAAVSGQAGLDPAAPIADIEATLPALIPAIIQHENGVQPYPDALIAQGIALEQSA